MLYALRMRKTIKMSNVKKVFSFQKTNINNEHLQLMTRLSWKQFSAIFNEYLSKNPVCPNLIYKRYQFPLTLFWKETCLTSYSLFICVLGDSLGPTNSQPFSTKDRDNDDDFRHCAQTYLGPWWYKACIYACLNCPYINTDYVPYVGQGVVWGAWLDLYHSMKFAEMKIRPVEGKKV